MALVNSDMGEEAYFGSKDGSFKRVDLAGLVKENFGLTEDDEISIDDVMYADKKFLVSGTYYEKTEEDVRELICNDLLSSVFSGNHHKLIFSCF